MQQRLVNNGTQPVPSSRALLRVEKLVKEFHLGGGTITALRDVTFSLDERQFIAIRGRSGAGKTTLLNVISGLDDPTSGHIWL